MPSCSFGDSMVMLGSMSDQNVGRLLKQPDEIGGAETQTCYLLVDDVDGHYERAKKAGAQFVSVITHNESGSSLFWLPGSRGTHLVLWRACTQAAGKRSVDRRAGESWQELCLPRLLLALVHGAMRAISTFANDRRSQSGKPRARKSRQLGSALCANRQPGRWMSSRASWHGFAVHAMKLMTR